MIFTQGKAQGAKASIQGTANEQAVLCYVENSTYAPFIRKKQCGSKRNPKLVIDKHLPGEATPHGGDFCQPDLIIDAPGKTIVIEMKSQTIQGTTDVKLLYSIFHFSHLLKHGFAHQCYLIVRGNGWKKGWKEFLLDQQRLQDFLPYQGYGEPYLQNGLIVVCEQDEFITRIQRETL